jgi:hypothetical protein
MFSDIRAAVQLREVREARERMDGRRVGFANAAATCTRLLPAPQSLYGPYGPAIGPIDVGVPDWQPGLGSYSE